jgi:crotonobetainyl-CoA:carnitine CoA-transferase CaiB-like acyl-CoA transferase
MTLPLEGVRVLDFTHVYAGPTCTRILADLGADVVKVEGLTRVDLVRLLFATDNSPMADPWNRGFYFSLRKPGKRSLTVELSTEAGRALLRRLVAGFDVVAESFTPRVMRQFGLDYESLRAIRPDIIMISLSGYGQTGPHAGWSAYGMGLEPASGISQVTGYAGGPPKRTGISFTDPLTGMVGAGAVLTALHYRRRTGRGQYIDLSEQEAAVAISAASLLDYQMNGRPPERRGNRSPHAAPQGCYRCRGRDEWVVISVRDDAEWSRFCAALGRPEWESDSRFATVLERHAHHDDLDALIEGWTRERGHYEAMRLLQDAGVPAAAVLNGKEMLFDPHFRARGQFDFLDHPVQGRRPIPRNLVAKFSRFDPRPRSAAPTLGQHNSEVLKEAGLSDDEIAALAADGVIGDTPRLAVTAGAGSRAVPSFDDLKEVGALLDYESDYKEKLGL